MSSIHATMPRIFFSILFQDKGNIQFFPQLLLQENIATAYLQFYYDTLPWVVLTFGTGRM